MNSNVIMANKFEGELTYMEFQSPISIQFVYHPDDKSSVEHIINYCKDRFSRNVDQPFLRALDFPIFEFTSLEAESAPSNINTMAKKSIVFAFIGNSTIYYKNWSQYIEKLNALDSVKLIPIALTFSALNLKSIGKTNAIRFFSYPDSNDKNLQLFIAIAHEIYRWLLQDDHKQLKLFLSHTKNDKIGVSVAKELKQYIDQNTTMSNFFDTNDIQIGNEFDDEILNSIKASTLIIIHSDTYSSRYWCQKEIISAKRNNRPIISVDYLDSFEDRSFPLMCNFPSIRYKNNPLNVLELALLETIRFYYCNELFKAYKHCGYIPEFADTFNTVPDNFAIREAKSEMIIYPEPELYPDEKEILSLDKQLYTPLSYNMIDLSSSKIGISISEPSNNELLNIGQDVSHLRNLSQLLSHKLIRSNAILIYGGDLRNDSFTELLFEEARIIKDRNFREGVLLKNYAYWPSHLLQKQDYIKWAAEYTGICEFVQQDKPDDISNEYSNIDLASSDIPHNKYVISRCLSYMRENMIDECNIRISAGGKMTGYVGCMPGVLEEIYIALKKNKPIFLLGGFGGISAKICQYIMTKKLPAELTINWQISNNDNYYKLLHEYQDNNRQIDYSWITGLDYSSLHNGLDEEDNKKLFITPFADEAIYLISKGLRRLF